jgi:PAS domain S-box-containing protein
MIVIVGLGAAVLLLFLAGLWRLVVSREQKDHAEQLSSLSSVINSQNQLLSSINSALTDPISLTEGEKGVYHSVNRAFSQAIGRSAEEILGRNIEEVFGSGEQARRMRGLYQQVSISGEALTVNETLFLQSKRYHYQIVMAPMFRADDNDATKLSIVGVVSAFRDITEQVETQERSQRVVQQTIDALVRAIEQIDPYLAGHSRMMMQCALLIAREMHLSEAEVNTIAAAASLSQVGKMFVPKEIINKPGALTAEEKQEMERHVEYAHNLLENIEFELPVLQTIDQINEHMDGSGYPKGLKGEDIGMPARILAVANAFCAMMRPRSYRPALPVEKAFDQLAKQNKDFDQEVVEKLRLLLTTRGGENLLQSIRNNAA